MIVFYAYDDNKTFHCYDGEKDYFNKRRPTKGYEMLKGFNCTASKEGLIEYFDKLQIASNELKDYCEDELKDHCKRLLESEPNAFSFITPDGNNMSLMCRMFSILRRDKEELRKEYEHVTESEHDILSKMHGSGLMYGEKYKGKSYGYDVSAFYGGIMGDNNRLHKFSFPVKRGEIITIDELPKKVGLIKYGTYHVKITSDDKKLRFLIGYSKHDWYDHYTLKRVMMLQYKFGYDIKITLIQDGKPNALVYDKSKLTLATDIFWKYFSVLKDAKDKLKDNPLPKLLINTLYGFQKIKYNPMHITRSKWMKMDEKKKLAYKIDIKRGYQNKEGEDVYYALKRDRMYKYQLARMSFFLPCRGREYMSHAIQPIINDIVRVHTDGIITKTNCDDILKGKVKIWEKEDKYYGKKLIIKNATKIKIKHDGKYITTVEYRESLINKQYDIIS